VALGGRLAQIGEVALPTPRDHRLLDDLRIDRVKSFLTDPDPAEYRLTVYRLDPDTQRTPDPDPVREEKR
jgi:hypothetical protein